MPLLIEAALTIIVLPITLQAIFVFAETLSFLRCRHVPDPAADGADDVSSVILIPAHDEEHIIEQSLRDLQKRIGPHDRILVVADNCTDATADVARKTGVEVIERQEPERRGKGFALDYGIRALKERQPPDILIILDADCHVTTGTIAALKAQVIRDGMPAQALYLMKAPTNPGFYQKIAEFAWYFRIAVRFVGDRCLGIPTMILGSGMAFRFGDIAAIDLATADIVEDMKMSLELAAKGKYTRLLSDAHVYSEFPSEEHAQTTQRTRWEHGHLDMILHRLPRYALTGIRRGDFRLLGLAFSMGVFPLTLLAAMLVVLLLVTAITALFGAGTLPLLLIGTGTGLFVLAIILAWLSGGREILTARDFLQLPFYVLRKFPLYRQFLVRRETNWVKTERK